MTSTYDTTDSRAEDTYLERFATTAFVVLVVLAGVAAASSRLVPFVTRIAEAL